MLYNSKEEKIRPTVEMFNVLIGTLAKNGKVRRAFNLYNDASVKKAFLNPFTPKSDQLQFSLSVSDISHSMENLAFDSLLR